MSSKPQTRRNNSPSERRRRFPVASVAGGLATIALVVTVLLTLGSANDEPLEVGAPTVTGDPLPRFVDETVADAALGLPAPEVTGADFAGDTVTIAADGRAKIVLFLAHWCPGCQAEVPLVVEWLKGDPLPDNVDLYTISIFVSRSKDNYPPSDWLAREGWTAPVILDDEANTVAAYFGIDSTPGWVFIDAEGTVVGRLTGGLHVEEIEAIVANLADL